MCKDQLVCVCLNALRTEAKSVLSDALLLEEFPIKKTTAYFNNASYTPMSKSAINAVAKALEYYSTNGPSDALYLTYKDGANKARKSLALLTNVKDPQDVVFTESATQSISLVANGFKFSKGDSLIIRGGATEHPSNFLPWKYYSSVKHLDLIDLEPNEFGFIEFPILDSALKSSKAKLVVLTHVLYNLGTIMNAREVGKIAHENGAKFFLDVSQSIGNIEVDLNEIDCDFAAGTAAKWLCGPLGLGFLYCKKEAVESLEPLNFGANAATYKPDGSYTLFSGAARLQEGFRNWAFTYGLESAIELVNRFGMSDLIGKNKRNALKIIEEIDSSKNYKFIGSRNQAEQTCITPIECLERKPLEIVQELSKKGIVIAEREIAEKKILRISPHFYNDEKEVDRLIDAL